jgi:hypothetical protein
MHRYIQQLLDDFKTAAGQAGSREIDYGKTYEEFEEAMLEIENAEPLPSEEQFGVSYQELPPAEMLTDEQMKLLTDAIITAVEAQGSGITFPDEGKAPISIRYEALREHFKEGFCAMPGWVIDFCSGWCPDCVFVDYCNSWNDTWTKEELERERKKICP